MDSSMFTIIVMIITGIALFMFQGRMQKKQSEKRKSLLENLIPGNEVITIGGLHGLVDSVDADNKTVTLDCEGIFLVFEQWAVRDVKQSVKTTGVREREVQPVVESAVVEAVSTEE